jgi:hypothetical protein
MLKNLDIIMMPRGERTFCRKDDMNQGDDKTDSASAPTISYIPKELEGKTTPLK